MHFQQAAIGNSAGSAHSETVTEKNIGCAQHMCWCQARICMHLTCDMQGQFTTGPLSVLSYTLGALGNVRGQVGECGCVFLQGAYLD